LQCFGHPLILFVRSFTQATMFCNLKDMLLLSQLFDDEGISTRDELTQVLQLGGDDAWNYQLSKFYCDMKAVSKIKVKEQFNHIRSVSSPAFAVCDVVANALPVLADGPLAITPVAHAPPPVANVAAIADALETVVAPVALPDVPPSPDNAACAAAVTPQQKPPRECDSLSALFSSDEEPDLSGRDGQPDTRADTVPVDATDFLKQVTGAKQ
jgi:hypothetical protein